ncbi:MAG: hypothetical protein IPM77_09785 [Crocinitomicaceae bacterium]|nr:hypothetical protein [Crocinitomicaceae bacterium]
MFKIILVTISLFLLSCNSTDSVNDELIEAEKNVSQVEKCLKSALPEYFENLDLISKILMADNWIDGSRDSYADLYKFMYVPILDSFEISDENRIKLNFLEELEPLYAICSCSNNVTHDTFMTENQVNFYKEFDGSHWQVAIDTDKLSALVHAMSDDEFNAYGIKEATLIFCGHRIIRGQYFPYRNKTDDE